MRGADKKRVRSDSWSQASDERLTEIVLQHIRTRGTQLEAFKQAAKEFGRTAAACGYRWNGVLRKQYGDQVEAAKRDRKKQQPYSGNAPAQDDMPAPPKPMNSSMAMADVISFLQSYDAGYQALHKQVKHLQAERNKLQNRVRQLEDELKQGTAVALTPEQLASDTQTLMAILGRARNLVSKDTLEEQQKAAD